MSYSSGHQFSPEAPTSPSRSRPQPFIAALRGGIIRASPRRRAATPTTSCIRQAGSLGPVVFWIVVGTVVVLGLWSAATATYFAFRDDVLTRLIARQAEMQYAYEDRIAELRGKVDRPPAVSCSTRSSSTRSSTRSCGRQTAPKFRATALGPFPTYGHRIDSRSAGTWRCQPDPTQVRQNPRDQRHRDLRGTTGSRGTAGVAHAVLVSPARNQFAKNAGRRQRSRSAADVARPGRASSDGGAQLGRGRHDSRVRRMRGVVS